MFLVYGGDEELRVRGYTDSGFQSDPDDSKAQSGYMFILNGGAISWRSSKQGTVADSTMEAEYVAASEAIKDSFWIKKFITKLGVVPSVVDPIELYCDNSSAVALAKDPRSHNKAKHIECKDHLIRDHVAKGHTAIRRVYTIDNVADPMTKALQCLKFEPHRFNIGLKEGLM